MATIQLQVYGPVGKVRNTTAVIDTGFTGSLTLPAAIARALGLIPHVTRQVRLADGKRALLDSYLAEVEWDGRRHRVVALSAEGPPLLGVSLLRGFRLLIDFDAGGAVSISALP